MKNVHYNVRDRQLSTVAPFVAQSVFEEVHEFSSAVQGSS